MIALKDWREPKLLKSYLKARFSVFLGGLKDPARRFVLSGKPKTMPTAVNVTAGEESYERLAFPRTTVTGISKVE